MSNEIEVNGMKIPSPVKQGNTSGGCGWDSYFVLRVGRHEYFYDNEDNYVLARDAIESIFEPKQKHSYIGVKTKNIDESKIFQQALFDKGFEWVNSGKEVLNHTNFYARLYDMKIITCYHDPSIDEESIFLDLEQIKEIN